MTVAAVVWVRPPHRDRRAPYPYSPEDADRRRVPAYACSCGAIHETPGAAAACACPASRPPSLLDQLEEP